MARNNMFKKLFVAAAVAALAVVTVLSAKSMASNRGPTTGTCRTPPC